MSDTFTLFKTINITEPITLTIVDKDDKGNNFLFDDIVVIAEVKGTNNTEFKFAVKTDDGRQITDYIYYGKASAVSDTTARKFNITCIRSTEQLWTLQYGGQFQQANNLIMPSNPTYNNKIDTVLIGPPNNSYFTEGTIKIYGRKRL